MILRFITPIFSLWQYKSLENYIRITLKQALKGLLPSPHPRYEVLNMLSRGAWPLWGAAARNSAARGAARSPRSSAASSPGTSAQTPCRRERTNPWFSPVAAVSMGNPGWPLCKTFWSRDTNPPGFSISPCDIGKSMETHSASLWSRDTPCPADVRVASNHLSRVLYSLPVHMKWFNLPPTLYICNGVRQTQDAHQMSSFFVAPPFLMEEQKTTTHLLGTLWFCGRPGPPASRAFHWPPPAGCSAPRSCPTKALPAALTAPPELRFQTGGNSPFSMFIAPSTWVPATTWSHDPFSMTACTHNYEVFTPCFETTRG